MPDAVAALTTILVIVSLVFCLFFLIIPPLVTEVNFLSELNFYEVFHNILAQFPGIKSLLLKVGNEEDLKQISTDKGDTTAKSKTINDIKNAQKVKNQEVSNLKNLRFIQKLFRYYLGAKS